jgi:hypothetical protein
MKDEKGIWGYSLDSELLYIGEAIWNPAAQMTVDAIRKVDKQTLITIPGADHWGNSNLWYEHSADLRITDPSDNVAFEASCYGDWDFSGHYDMSYEEQSLLEPDKAAYPDVMKDRATPFAQWLAQNNYRGIISEWGVPPNDDNWAEVARRFLGFLKEQGIGSSAWAYGPWWDPDYELLITPDSTLAAVLGEFT